MEGYEKVQFYYLWIFANVIAFVLASLVGYEVSDLVAYKVYSLIPADSEAIIHGTLYSFIVSRLPYALVNGVIFGLVLGVTEWLFLREPIALSKRWIIISIIAWDLSAVFWALLEDVPALGNTMMQGILAGALLGLIQWVYLRPFLPRARWWILARMICGIGIFGQIIFGWYPVATGFVNGLITGLAAVSLLPNLPTTVMPIALEEELQ